MSNDPMVVTVLVITPRNKAKLSGRSRTRVGILFQFLASGRRHAKRGTGLTEQEVNTSTCHSSSYKLTDVNPDPGGGLGTARWQKANKPSPNSPHVPSTALSELSLLDRIDSRNIKVGKFTFVP